VLCDLLIGLTLLSNFALVAMGRVNKVIMMAVFQGVILGLLPLAMGLGRHPHIVLMAISAVAVKGWLIPYLFRRAFRLVKIQREVDPYIGYPTSLILCALGTGMSILIARNLPIDPASTHALLLPASLATLFTGCLLLVSRKKAITQVAGYLVLENGIYIFGLLLVEEMPLLVETGILLDLFVGIFIMGIVINHISVAFDSLETGNLSKLKD
jgi:hydrogenase-4 component E